jgi:predicted metal-dependent peptidase
MSKEYTQKELDDALTKAHLTIMQRIDSAFFFSVCASLLHEFTTKVPTAATDGLRVLYNPTFFMSLTPPERVFLVLHETLHVVFNHVTRRGDRDPRMWNMAGDYVINDLLIKLGYLMPQGGLHDIKYRDIETEAVYLDIYKDEEKQDQDFQEDIIPNDMDDKDLEEAIDDILMQAEVIAQVGGDESIGSIPGEVSRYLDKLKSPKLPWNVILRKFMNDLKKTDYSFKRPNRRYMPEHILPSAYGYGMEHIAVAIDVSGSVTDDQFHTFISEVSHILKEMNPTKLTVLQFDDRITSVDEVRVLKDLMNIEFTGGGGTKINPVMQWMNKHKPKGMLIFTDGFFHYHFDKPERPLVWLVHSNENFKNDMQYGQVIDYPLDD